MRGLSAGARLLAVFSGVALVAAAFVPLPPVRGATDLPIWSVGDSWTYVGYGFELPAYSGTFRYVIAGVDSVALNGTSVPTYHVEVWVNATAQTPYLAADRWYRTSDLAIVRQDLVISVCKFLPPLSGPACNNVTITSTMSPPLPLHFPLTAGDAWSDSTQVTTEFRFRDNGSTAWSNSTGWANDSVSADAAVSVPAGNFTATPLMENYFGGARWIPFSFGAKVVLDIASAVRNVVRERDYVPDPRRPGNYSLFAMMELTSYTRAPPPWYDQTALGLTVWSWLVVAGAVVVGVAVLRVHRRRARAPRSLPPESPPPKP